MSAPVPPYGELRIVADVPSAFAGVVADELARATAAHAAASGGAGARTEAVGAFRWRLACSGGATARACYEALAARHDVAWSEIECFFGDERCVSADDPDANQRLVGEALGSRFEALAAFHPMDCDRPDAYQALLESVPPFDLIHLGLGPDGHTASLFAGSPALTPPAGTLVLRNADRSNANPHDRLTVTFECIDRSSLAVFTVAGEQKREALRRVLAGDDVPAARVRSGRVLWLADDDALGGGR